MLVLVLSLSLSLAESLAVENSPEVRIALSQYQEKILEYRAELFDFFPSLSLKLEFPDVSYYSDERYYPVYPEPIYYWQRFEQKLFSAGTEVILPFGGSGSILYTLLKRSEFYKLYKDREYYEGELEFDINQPLFGVSMKWDALKEKRIAVEMAKRNLERAKRDARKSVRRAYIRACVFERCIKTIINAKEKLNLSLDEIEYIRARGLIKEEDYYRSRSQYISLLIAIDEVQEIIDEAVENLRLFTNLDTFTLSLPPIPDTTREPLPDSYIELEDVLAEIEIASMEYSRAKRSLFPSLNFSADLGLRGRGEELEDARIISRNRWDLSVSLNIPIFSLSKIHTFFARRKGMEGLNIKKTELERKVEIDRRKMKDKLKRLILREELAHEACKLSLSSIMSIPEGLTDPSEKIKRMKEVVDNYRTWEGVLEELFILDVDFHIGGEE